MKKQKITFFFFFFPSPPTFPTSCWLFTIISPRSVGGAAGLPSAGCQQPNITELRGARCKTRRQPAPGRCPVPQREEKSSLQQGKGGEGGTREPCKALRAGVRLSTQRDGSLWPPAPAAPRLEVLSPNVSPLKEAELLLCCRRCGDEHTPRAQMVVLRVLASS